MPVRRADNNVLATHKGGQASDSAIDGRHVSRFMQGCAKLVVVF